MMAMMNATTLATISTKIQHGRATAPSVGSGRVFSMPSNRSSLRVVSLANYRNGAQPNVKRAVKCHAADKFQKKAFPNLAPKGGPKGAKEMEMFAMTAASKMMNPNVKSKIDALVELTDIEFGLYGVKFEEIMEMMDQCYRFTPTEYSSGVALECATTNTAGHNNGSCKVFAFGKMNELGEEQTLSLFCEHYEQVKGDPEGDSHLNIRNFMKNGWEGLVMADTALTPKDRIEEPGSSDGI